MQTHTHARTRTHARTHARSHMQTHTHTHTQPDHIWHNKLYLSLYCKMDRLYYMEQKRYHRPQCLTCSSEFAWLHMRSQHRSTCWDIGCCFQCPLHATGQRVGWCLTWKILHRGISGSGYECRTLAKDGGQGKASHTGKLINNNFLAHAHVRLHVNLLNFWGDWKMF